MYVCVCVMLLQKVYKLSMSSWVIKVLTQLLQHIVLYILARTDGVGSTPNWYKGTYHIHNNITIF